ncbi:hypothetical protein [Novacetimonas pomaceti]|uniref:hypothetical protein n=1 Tax=Novacetimonas pomaceti TaxID=2021998 RepID=UPI001057FCEB|nr:hypothetical protein [Novacetimonas pomaceti]
MDGKPARYGRTDIFPIGPDRKDQPGIGGFIGLFLLCLQAVILHGTEKTGLFSPKVTHALTSLCKTGNSAFLFSLHGLNPGIHPTMTDLVVDS